MTSARATRIAAGLGFLAVALGAFGAHGLKPLLASNGTVEMWEKAVFYHFIHTVMLYVLALAKVHWLVFVTPFGGVSLLAGWVALWRNIKHQAPNAKE